MPLLSPQKTAENDFALRRKLGGDQTDAFEQGAQEVLES